MQEGSERPRAMPHQPAIRQAISSDIATLVRHRRLMFEDMAAAQSLDYQARDLDRMDRDYQVYLTAHFSDGTALAWVAELDGQVIASGTVTLLPWPPCPSLPGHWSALLHSMYTTPEHRKQGIGRRIIEAATAHCKAAGRKCIILGGRGSDVGRGLYETVGFKPAENMRMFI